MLIKSSTFNQSGDCWRECFPGKWKSRLSAAAPSPRFCCLSNFISFSTHKSLFSFFYFSFVRDDAFSPNYGKIRNWLRQIRIDHWFHFISRSTFLADHPRIFMIYQWLHFAKGERAFLSSLALVSFFPRFQAIKTVIYWRRFTRARKKKHLNPWKKQRKKTFN